MTTTTTRDGQPVTDTSIYQVTPSGLEQIKQWLLHEWCCEAEDVGDLDDAVYTYARLAEEAQDGEIELRAWQTASGRPAYLTPEREAVKREYAYRTDSEVGSIYAVDFADARAQLDTLVPEECIADGGWGWVDDCEAEQPRYEVGYR